MPDRPSAKAAPTLIGEELQTDWIVNLAAFKVTTDLGNYSEVSSSSETKTSMVLKDISGSVQIINALFVADKSKRFRRPLR